MKRSSDLFAVVRKVGADDGKGIHVGFGAETTGDFLLEFRHSQVAFGLVVVEGNAQVGEEAQDFVAVLAQSPNEVAGWGLFDSPAGSRTTGTGRIASFGVGEDGVVAGPQTLDVAGGQCLEDLGLPADQGIAWHNWRSTGKRGSVSAARSARRDGRRTNVGRRRPMAVA